MFITHLRRVYRSANMIITREVRNRASKRNLNPNPGMDNRIAAFRDEGLRIEDDDAEEFVEQSESDFSQAGISYTEHMKETIVGKHEVRHHIVKEKYFKEYLPNLLTWSEKEQIRHLHNTEPDEWTPEKLAESFPVTVPVVKKLLKYPWKPASEVRIARHDASAMRNWKELKDGTSDMPKELREHFLKFSTRTIPPLKKESVKIDLTHQKNMGEYESIVRRCATKAQEQSKEKVKHKSTAENTKGTQKPVQRDLSKITLEELAMKIKERIDQGSHVNNSDKLFLSTYQSKPEAIESVNNEIELDMSDNNTKIVKYEDKEQTKSIMEYPERIRIPKKAYKKGATYKVNDCYYDYDGRFLYRVLGM